MRNAAAALVVALLAIPTALAGNVLVVGNGGGASHSDIGEAVAAAADGDTILVRSGQYFWFTVNDKSLTIAADAGADVQVEGVWTGTRIQNLSAGKRVLIRGIRFTSTPFPSGTSTIYIPGIRLLNNSGPIEFEDVSANDFAGIEVVSSSSVLLSRVTCNGAFGTVFRNSTVVASDCTFVGVDGRDAASSLGHHLPQISGSGFAGINVLFGGTLTLSDCTVSGGQGGDGFLDWDGTCLPASSGGPAILVTGAAATIRVVGGPPTLIPGQPGVDAPTCSSNATSGNPIENYVPVTLSSFVADPLEFAAPTVAREGQSLTISMTGPNVFAHWLVSASGATSPWVSGGVGHLLVASPFLVLPIGAAPTPPNWNLSFIVPELGPGISNVNLRIQAVGCATPSNCVLGGITSVVLLDSSF